MTGNPHEPEIELTVVMPCLNEAATVGTCIDKARRCMEENGVVGEIVIADNGSTDASREIAAGRGARVVSVAAKGYGSALHGGIAAARGRYVMMGDADDSYDFANLMPFLEKLRHGCDLVMGNRFQGGIKPGAMPPLHRYLGNPVLSFIGRLFFHPPVGDFHCGLRGFSRDAFDRMRLETTGMEFASEMVVKASLLGMRIAEAPTTLSPDGRDRPPHLRSWRDGWRHLRFLLMFSPRWLFFYPSLLVMGIGVFLTLWLLGGPRTVGCVTFDVHTILYAMAAVAIGFNMLLFGVYARVFGMTTGLLPAQPTLMRAFRYVNLEVGLIVGAVVFLAGLLGGLIAVHTWSNAAFGPLDPETSLRIVIPSVLGLILGSQIILSSFFLSILGLGRRRDAFQADGRRDPLSGSQDPSIPSGPNHGT
jgi:glycosyltransferase involved in cell wall biosynthesis